MPFPWSNAPVKYGSMGELEEWKSEMNWKLDMDTMVGSSSQRSQASHMPFNTSSGSNTVEDTSGTLHGQARDLVIQEGVSDFQQLW